MCLCCRDTCHRDIVNLQVEMVRQFYIQLVGTGFSSTFIVSTLSLTLCS